MCTVTMAVGAAIGATTSAITGNDPLQGAILGGASAGFGGLGAGSTMGKFGTFLGASPGFLAGQVGVVSTQALVGTTVAGLAGGVAMNMLAPKQQDYSQYYQGAYNPIAYNTQQSQITGSGGRQAPALLAAEIKRAKKRREGQAAQGELGLATSLSNTGLQLA